MKTLTLLFTLIFCFPVMALQVVGNQTCNNCKTILGRIIDLSNPNVIILETSHDTTGFDTGVTIVDASMSHYSPPTGRKAVVLGGETAQTSGAAEPMQLVYSDEFRINVSTAINNPFYCGNAGSGPGTRLQRWTSVVGGRVEFSCVLVVPAGKFLHTQSLGAGLFNTRIYIGECNDTGSCEFDN